MFAHRPLESELIPYSASQGLPAQAVLVLAPHPDDEVFGCGGAIARHVSKGHPVHVVVLTDGALYGDVQVRQHESQAAAKVLGYGEPEFWNYPDRALHCSDALVQRLVDKIAQTGADLVYAPSPWEIHPDHRQTQLLAVEAVRRCASQVRLAFYEVGAPLRPNLLLDITPLLQTKDTAMRCFTSQLAQQDYGRHIHALNQYRSYTLAHEVLAAEAFWLVSPNELAQIASIGLLVGVSPGLQEFPATAPGLMPKVSILIRSMDRGYLVEALDSVALQTYPHLEVVVVAARPDHQPLPAKCGPFPVRLLQTDVPLARSQAANKAMAQARGELFLFLDDDDWLMPGHIARLAQTLTHQPHALAAYTGISVVDSNGHPKGQAFDLPFDAIRQMAGNLTPIHAVLFRANVLSQGCRFDEALDLYEDWDFWLQLAKLAPMVHLPGVSGVYRIHDSSGVHTDPGPSGAAAATIYQKWAADWSPEQISLMMQRVWTFPELQSRLTDTIQHSSETTQHLAEIRQQMVETNDVLTTARRDLTETQRLLADSDQQLTDTRLRLAQSNQSLLDANQEASELGQLLAQTKQVLTQTEQQLAATRQGLTDANQQLETGLHLQAQSDARTAQQQLQIEQQTQEIDAKTAELARQRHDQAALLGSHSWRITMPLRWLAERSRASLVGQFVHRIRSSKKNQ